MVVPRVSGEADEEDSEDKPKGAGPTVGGTTGGKTIRSEAIHQGQSAKDKGAKEATPVERKWRSARRWAHTAKRITKEQGCPQLRDAIEGGSAKEGKRCLRLAGGG